MLGEVDGHVTPVSTVRNSSCGKVMFLQVSVCPWGEGVPASGSEGSVCLLPSPRQSPSQTATAAGGTHPTGMHSYFIIITVFMSLKFPT